MATGDGHQGVIKVVQYDELDNEEAEDTEVEGVPVLDLSLEERSPTILSTQNPSLATPLSL